MLHAIDHPGELNKRLSHDHGDKRFLADTSSFGAKVVMSGPLNSDDGSMMIGSLFLVDTADRADPFPSAGHLALGDHHRLHRASRVGRTVIGGGSARLTNYAFSERRGYQGGK